MNYKMLTCLNAADPMPMKLCAKKMSDPNWWMSKQAKADLARQKELQAFECGDHTPMQVYGRSLHGIPVVQVEEKQPAVTFEDVNRAAHTVYIADTKGYGKWLKSVKQKLGISAGMYVAQATPEQWAAFVEAAEARMKELL